MFKPVWDVIKALRSHDEVLGEELDELRRELGRSGRLPQMPGKIHLDLPERVGVNFARAFGVRLVNETTSSWEYRCGSLEQFVERHGHARVPASCTVDDFHLGARVVTQLRGTPKAILTPTVNTDFKRCPAGRGIPMPTSGKRVSPVSLSTSKFMLTLASRVITWLMATSLDNGSPSNAAATPEARSEARCRPPRCPVFDSSSIPPVGAGLLTRCR